MSTDKLKKIGFYTLTDNRARNTSVTSPLWRCELIVTDRCNFKCPYCRGVRKEDRGSLSWKDAKTIINLWCDEGLKHVRLSGGEPTLWNHLPDAVQLLKNRGVKRIAISSNGSADLSYYKSLIAFGVNDFSISLDSCCSITGNKMTGRVDYTWEKVVSNIKELSKLTYVTTGTVFTIMNNQEINKIIKFANSLGVSDIRLIPAAQVDKYLPKFEVPKEILKSYPILRYRLNNFGRVRGITNKDNPYCPLVLDDMAVLNNKHYPCIIYLREHGHAIGKVGKTMRKDREDWYKIHNCYDDPICKNNCLDVCIDYNNRVKHYK